MEMLERIASTARRALRLPRKVSEEEFKQWRRTSLDPVVRSGRCYVPMPGLDDTRHYKDKQNLHHLGRYEWVVRVLSAGKTRPARLLDCACGVGYGSAKLAAVADAVEAVDSFEAALRTAAQRYDRTNLTWHPRDVAGLRDLFEAGTFDVIVSFQTIESVEDDQRFLDDLHALLRPGGVLFIDTPLRKHRVDKPENTHHRRYYAVDDWLDMLMQRFETVTAFDALPELAFLERCAMPQGGSIARCVKAGG